MDADARIGPDGVTALLDTLQVSGAAAASLALRFDTRGAGRLARWYHEVWSACPHFGPGHVGAGLYALTEAGRRRFTSFPPDAIPDDLFVMCLFRPTERMTAPGWFAAMMPRTNRDLVRVRRRQVRARWALRAAVADGRLPAEVPVRGDRRWLVPFARRPTSWPALITFVLVTGWAHLTARLQQVRRAQPVWERDQSTRCATQEGGP